MACIKHGVGIERYSETGMSLGESLEMENPMDMDIIIIPMELCIRDTLKKGRNMARGD